MVAHVEPERNRLTRPRLALVLVVGFFIGSTGDTLSKAPGVMRAIAERGHQFAALQLRFEPAAGVLPREVIAYFSDAPPDSGADLIAQYVLAPRILRANGLRGSQMFVLENSMRPGSHLAVPPGLRLIRDFGNGVRVLRLD